MQRISDQYLDVIRGRIHATAPVPASNTNYAFTGTMGAVGAASTTSWHQVMASNSPKISIMEEHKLQYMMDIDDGDISFAVFSAERGQELTCLFEPENDINVKEHMKISLLMMLMMQGDFITCEEPLQFIRKHHLERHFKISVAPTDV